MSNNRWRQQIEGAQVNDDITIIKVLAVVTSWRLLSCCQEQPIQLKTQIELGENVASSDSYSYNLGIHANTSSYWI